MNYSMSYGAENTLSRQMALVGRAEAAENVPAVERTVNEMDIGMNFTFGDTVPGIAGHKYTAC